MMRSLRRFRPSPGTVIASIALLVALSGTSYATVLQVPRNSVGTLQLKNNAVVSNKVRNGSLMRADFRAGQIPAGPAGPVGPAGAAGATGPAGPAGATGPTGPSDAVARVVNGPIALSDTGPFQTVANLSIPQAGRYVLWAKTGIVATGGSSSRVTCILVAGNEQIDQISTLVFAGNNGGVALLAARDFPTASSVDLRCTRTQSASSLQDIRMAAIRVANLTTT